MKTITKSFSLPCEKDLLQRLPGRRPLFLDIETTGLKAEYSRVYLVGCIHPTEDGDWEMNQWLAESPYEEKELLRQVKTYTQGFTSLVHFNGDHFDLPFLDARCKECGLEGDFARRRSLDLYREFRCCKNLCLLPNARQKTFEQFLKISREDRYDGGKLIPVYYRYVGSRDENLLHLLLLHNEEDVLGMTKLLAMYPYADLITGRGPYLSGDPQVLSDSGKELLLFFPMAPAYPTRISFHSEGWYGILQNHRLQLKIPLTVGELRYYFPDPENYYYLPREDIAVHKSVATYVDKAFKAKATPENCCARREGTFLPLPCELPVQTFREQPKGAPYAEWTAELLSNRSFWESYLSALFPHFR